MKQWKWYVYILECLDGFYYTGLTWDISNRMSQHAAGVGSGFTARHGFKALRYCEEFEDLEQARLREIQLKDFSRKKKQALWSSQPTASNSKATTWSSQPTASNNSLSFERSEN